MASIDQPAAIMSGGTHTPPRRPNDPLPPLSSQHSAQSLLANRHAQPVASASSQPVSIESLLAAHANSSNPAIAALTQILAERNTLSSQNAQLWKHIEKHRAAYSHVNKDLERVRAERDAYRAKLQALGENVDVVLKSSRDREKALRASSSASGLRSSEKSTPQTLSQPRADPVRHQSDDPSHRDELASRDRPNPIVTVSHSPSTPNPPSAAGAPSDLSVTASASTSISNPVHPPPRSDSVHADILSQSFKPLFIPIPQPSSQPPSASGFSANELAIQFPKSHAANDTPRPIGHSRGPSAQLIPESLQPGQSMPSVHHSTSNLSLPMDTRPHMLSRDSRVSLPDEAKRYITTMTDSPLTSPRWREHSHSRTSSPAPSSHNPAAAQELNIDKPPARKDLSDGGEFLDLDLDDEEDSVDDSINEQSSISTSPIELEREPSDHQTEDKARGTAAEDFPLPPFTHPNTPITSEPSSLLRQQQQAQMQALGYSQAVTIEQNRHADTPTTPTANSYNPHMSFNSTTSVITSVIPPQSGQPAFRALPLLPHDLPRTRIQVTNSTIRPNDRGKDVLSFIVSVDPGNGKEPWIIEKLYSDVLGLDQRARARVGKNVGKKIANLPDGKLWRDHAPSKVDQRKAVLEYYLQTLISLPVKYNDEIIAFLTSDIIKGTHKPVSREGYKEGYLTKRGKNFGGWKTRFFVLQGPVLEYFESRGGTHLSSITITGAQIGRQQKSADRRESDEENEYRHAFLIIEPKKASTGVIARHVLCAESDEDRDNWVDVLVRYVSGSYSEEQLPADQSSLTLNISAASASSMVISQPRSSISSNPPTDLAPSPITRDKRQVGRAMSKDDISVAHAVPLSQLSQDPANAKLFHNAAQYDDHSFSSSPIQGDDASPTTFTGSQTARRLLDKGVAGHPATDSPLSSSLPSPSPLDGAGGEFMASVGPRANSELGHYPDLAHAQSQAKLDPRVAAGSGSGRTSSSRHPQPPPDRSRQRHNHRTSYHPTLNPVRSSPPSPQASHERERAPSPDSGQGQSTPRVQDMNSKVKISGPMNGAFIPAGYKFGAKDAPPESSPSHERREKAKSRMFWAFGRPGVHDDVDVLAADKQPAVTHVPRAVFGVSIEESLEVAEIATLPAIVFRCIRYLEEKKAEQEEGIYRLSGSSAVIKSLKDRFNTEGDVDLLASNEYWDPHAIAGLLKSFFRELPASILTRELHLQFLAVMDLYDPQERIKELSSLISKLPIANYSLLRALTAHLILIVQNANVNKMTMRNVGIVFSPTLGIPAGVFSLMLAEFNRVFNVEDDSAQTEEWDVDEKGDETVRKREAGADTMRRNSRQYSDAAADQLLGLSGRKLSGASSVSPTPYLLFLCFFAP
ncbi:hypothetical protein EW146_g1736 [Bondarzewia mesenterica]|uniref:RhoGAP-domain-containing protein n=1 Tax=Bondarzewia mesenterica TaxID=1095465 RepID=A0A4S4M305_9AGAM|nr:hypothetical protein EW146_g1736 [Bondarzewia mesenterica]